MKFLSFLFFYAIPSSLFLCAGLCCPPEDEPPIQLSIENNNLISIDNNATTFNLEDTIFIKCNIEDLQVTTDDQNIKLSDYFYQDLPETIILRHNMALYKDSNFGELVPIPINNKFIEVIEREVVSDTSYSDLTITSTFDGSNFNSKFGIKLKEKRCFLSFKYTGK